VGKSNWYKIVVYYGFLAINAQRVRASKRTGTKNVRFGYSAATASPSETVIGQVRNDLAAWQHLAAGLTETVDCEHIGCARSLQRTV